jgi:hypothetical protein
MKIIDSQTAPIRCSWALRGYDGFSAEGQAFTLPFVNLATARALPHQKISHSQLKAARLATTN